MIQQLVQTEADPAEATGELPPALLAAYRIAVVIPAYNEARHIAGVVRSVPAFVRHVIVVDDASRDATAAEVERLSAADPRVVLVRHAQNQGVGGAMVSGFRQALELHAQIGVNT